MWSHWACVFTSKEHTASFLLGHTFIVVTEPQRVCAEWLQEPVSCSIHDLQLCPRQFQEPCSDGALLLFCCAYWCLSLLFTHWWKHTVVRCIVLWHRSMYSQQWLRIHFIAAFLFAIWANYNIKKRRNPSGAHLQDQTGRDFQINLNCHFTCGNHVLPTSSRWICRHVLEWFHFSQSAWNLFYSITKYPSFPPHPSMYRWLTELMEQLGLSGAKVYRELKWNQTRHQKVPSFKITMAFGRLHKLQELAM